MHKDTSNTNPEGNKSPAIDYFIVLFGSILILTIVLTIVINQIHASHKTNPRLEKIAPRKVSSARLCRIEKASKNISKFRFGF